MRVIVIILLFMMVDFNSCHGFNNKKDYLDEESIVNKNNVIVYEYPNRNSNSVVNLNVIDLVYVKEITNIIILDITNKWYYLDTGKKESYKIDSRKLNGWVQSVDIARKNEFVCVSKTKELFIKIIYPEDEVHCHIYTNGKIKFKNVPGGKRYYYGKMYKYKNIISLNHMYYLFEDDEGEYNSRYFDIEILKNKSKYPF